MPKGKKTCPECSTEMTAITRECPTCGYDFSAAKKIRDEQLLAKQEEKRRIREEKRKQTEEEKEQKKKDKKPTKQEYINPVVVDMLATMDFSTEEKKKMTPIAHAKRILKYGTERASNLLKQAKSLKTWSHVDWEYVEERI